MTLAVIWQRFGPYHLARLKGAAAHIPRVVGIEVAARDHYAWEHDDDAHDFQRVTLFNDRTYESLSRREIRAAIFRQLEEITPDYVAINGWSVPEAVAALKWTRRNNKLAILMSESFEPSGNRIKEIIKSWRVRKFDAALVGGRWHAEYLQRLGFPKGKIEIGYDAVDNDHFAGKGAGKGIGSILPERRKGFAQKTSAPFSLAEKYFFANTRFLPRKKVDVLLRAFADYRRQVSTPWSLVISGSGECESTWKALAKSLDLESHVHWPGFIQYDDLPVYYGLASAFVHIASREAWGLVLNEAAASGLPIIAGQRVGATCEMVNQQNGILVDPADLKSVTNALVKLTNMDDEERAAMAAASRTLASQYSADRFGQGLSRLVAEFSPETLVKVRP